MRYSLRSGNHFPKEGFSQMEPWEILLKKVYINNVIIYKPILILCSFFDIIEMPNYSFFYIL